MNILCYNDSWMGQELCGALRPHQRARADKRGRMFQSGAGCGKDTEKDAGFICILTDIINCNWLKLLIPRISPRFVLTNLVSFYFISDV